MYFGFAFQASLVKIVLLQVKENSTITAKKRSYTDYGSLKEMGYLSGRLKIGFQIIFNKVVDLSRPSE